MALGNNAGAVLKSLVERVERTEEEIASLNNDKKEIYAEAKGHGFDTAVLRLVVKRRKQDSAKREETESLLELYEKALKGASKEEEFA